MNDQPSFPQSILIIDDDVLVCRQMVAYATEAAGPGANIQYVNDGAEAWKKIREQAFDFYVVDWKLPSVSGLALFNRIRRMRQNATTPVLVVSGLINSNDFRMLQEFPCTALVEKPFTKTAFIKAIEDLYRESNWYVNNADIVDGLSDLLASDPKAALQLIQKTVVAGAPKPMPLVINSAKKLREQGALTSAAKLLKSILEEDPRNIQAMTEFGKVLHLMGRHREALKFLREANILAPQNINRLCLMGEAELNLCNPESAKAYFEQALGVDQEELKARHGVQTAVDMLDILARPEHDHIPRTFASLLNITGISLVRSGNIAKGLTKYRNALRFLPLNERAAKVTFNMGLGYLRWGKSADALEWFQKSEKIGAGSFEKARGYVLKLQIAIGEVRSNVDRRRMENEIEQAAQEDFAEETLTAAAGLPEVTSSSTGVGDGEPRIIPVQDDEPEVASDSVESSMAADEAA